MGQRGQASTSEMVRVMRHLADVAAVRDTPDVQRRVLVDGLGQLFGTTLGWLVELDDCRPGRALRMAGFTLAGGLDPHWLRYAADFGVHVPPADDPYADHALRSDDVEQQWITDRVLPNLAAKRRYAPAVEVMEQARIGDGAVCMFRNGPAGDGMVCFSLHRCRGDPRMRDRDYALHRFALAELRHLRGRGHLPSVGPPAAGPKLSPRLRQVLDGVLRGLSPTQIARELDLSVWTVRDHVKRLIVHFGVHGRDELMARFVRRPLDGEV